MSNTPSDKSTGQRPPTHMRSESGSSLDECDHPVVTSGAPPTTFTTTPPTPTTHTNPASPPLPAMGTSPGQTSISFTTTNVIASNVVASVSATAGAGGTLGTPGMGSSSGAYPGRSMTPYFSDNVRANVIRQAVVSPDLMSSPGSGPVSMGAARSGTPVMAPFTPTTLDNEVFSVNSRSGTPVIPAMGISVPTASPFSHERALETFHKAREQAKEKIRREKIAQQPRSRSASKSQTAVYGEGAPSEEGDRLYEAIRTVMTAADGIDNTSNKGEKAGTGSPQRASSATRAAAAAAAPDWRDDDDIVSAPSAFFLSPGSLEISSNRVMETITSRGRAAQTDEELRMLYRCTDMLCYLDQQDVDTAAKFSLRREYSQGDLIVPVDSQLEYLYVVVWGEVEVFRPWSLGYGRAPEHAFRAPKAQSVVQANHTESAPTTYAELNAAREASAGEAEQQKIFTHVARLMPGQVFGTESCVFDERSKFSFRAGGATSKTVVSLIPFTVLREALGHNARFAQGVGSSIASAVDVFGPIRQFCRYVFSPTSAQNEYLPLWSIVDSYTKIHNVIHTKVFMQQLDTGAWGYAINRLPENLTSTFCFDLVHSLPPFVATRMRKEAHVADVRKQATSREGRTRTAVSYITTKERRRCTWHLGMEGKTLVLLRDSFTDLLDFLTMLCVHIIESNKLRGRIQGMVHPPAIDVLDNYLRQREEEKSNNVSVSAEDDMDRIKAILRRMPLSDEEQAGLLRNWKQDTLLRIYEIMMHREEYNVRVDPSVSRKFQTNPFHEWAINLRSCVLEKLGLDRTSPLPDDLYVDVISSNTHCIKNLLCSFNRKYRKEILDYAVRKESKRLGKPEDWHNPDDMLYVALTGFLQNERPDLKEEYTKSLEENGISVLQDTAMTGLQVDVIPVHLLDFDTIDETVKKSLQEYFEQNIAGSEDGESGRNSKEAPTWAQVSKPLFQWRRVSKSAAGSKQCSPLLLKSNTGPGSSFYHATQVGRLPHHFIINMDFAFGAQAEGIARAVFSAFGKRIRSVSVMGKAGGLMGKRGDIQLASHVLLSKSSLILEDNQDELRNCRNQDLTIQRLRELAGPAIDVMHGKVLTVTGTMLQNVPLLQYYRNVWRCIGTEMEGSYFARVIEDFYRQGIAHPNLTTRFAYYSSDLPLAESDAAEEAARTHKAPVGAATLSAPMTPQEGVPPLYAIARSFMENVLVS